MKYCLNIQDGSGELTWRLQKDSTWQFCQNNAIISDNDLTTQDEQIIFDLQKTTNLVFTVGDKKYICNPDGNKMEGFSDVLMYTVYGYCEEYPKPPSFEQLKEALSNRERLTEGFLVLKTDGKFYVATRIDWKKMTEFASIDLVCRLAHMPKRKLQILQLERRHYFNKRELNDFYKIAMNSWRNFVKNKEIGDDIDLYDDLIVDDVNKVYAELLHLCSL